MRGAGLRTKVQSWRILSLSDHCWPTFAILLRRIEPTSERWKRIGSDEERCVAVAALMDYGYEDGAAQCMMRLPRSFIGRAHQLGRDYLAAPIEHLGELVALSDGMHPEKDERSLRWDLKDPPITQPYIDLRYW